MKKLLLMLLLATGVAGAQNCDSLLLADVDKMNGKRSWKMHGFIELGTKDNGLMTTLARGESATIIWLTFLHGVSCVDEGDKVEVLFTDGSRTTLVTNSTFNCQGKATVYLDRVWGTGSQMKELSQKYIETVRFWGRGAYVQKDFDADNAKLFNETLNCMMNLD